MGDSVFYEDGLNFECQRCSACCRFDPGYVFLTRKDLDALCKEKGISSEDFLEKYCRTVDAGGERRISLNEKANFDCIFWENGGCSVYNSRPVQCRTFPFWRSYMDDAGSWENLKNSCPGVGKGCIVDKEEIEKKLAERDDEPILTV